MPLSDPGSPSLGPASHNAPHEMLEDAGVRALLRQYANHSGAQLRELSPNLYELVLPSEERIVFGGRHRLAVAFSVEALHDDPDAEMAVVGSVFVEQLVSAIRARGTRRVFGLVPSTVSPAAELARLPAAIANGRADPPQIRLTQHPIGRLTARVTVRAGSSLVEHITESGIFDLATGVPLAADVATACEAATANAPLPPVDSVPPMPAARLVSLMLADLEQRLAPEIARQRSDAERALAQELARLDRYFTTMLDDSMGRGGDIPDAAARRVIEAQHERRRQEEIDRHAVRAVVHPVQLAEWAVAVQRADWILASHDGHVANVAAQRTLVGDSRWTYHCQTCGTTAPQTLVICHEDHAGCSACATTCTVCSTGFCREHGLLACHVDGAPACSTHARTCVSCRRPHCSAHEDRCTDGDHPACSSCLSACAHCGTIVCDAHASLSAAEAPRGQRRLCAQCVRYCEGGTGEVVAPDEVARCASCDRVVCEHHQTRCSVDGQVHCSSHMRRTDRSRRLVCRTDRAECAYEPHAIFAVDEVERCSSCGALACSEHLGTCVEDEQRHCTAHLVPLRDRPGAAACSHHHTVCRIDGVTFSLTGTTPCPVCTQQVCREHVRSCANCGRSVCTADVVSQNGVRCITCQQLSVATDPDDALLRAAIAVLGDGGRPKSWKVSRDPTHRVVELDMGWTRRVVFTVRHGAEQPEGVMRHSLLGSRRA